MPIDIISQKIARENLRPYVLYEDFVKAVVDCEKKIIAVGGQLHADEEEILLENGSDQKNIWGINLYLDKSSDQWIEYDSMINMRPSQNNRSRSVENAEIRALINEIITSLVIDA